MSLLLHFNRMKDFHDVLYPIFEREYLAEIPDISDADAIFGHPEALSRIGHKISGFEIISEPYAPKDRIFAINRKEYEDRIEHHLYSPPRIIGAPLVPDDSAE